MNTESMIELVAEQALWESLVSSRYGEAHWLRVFKLTDKIINCLMLERKTKLVVNKGIVGLASLLHEIGRIHDGKDPNHGFRGASIAFRVAGNIFATGPNKLALATPKGMQAKLVELGRIADIVNRHCMKGPGDYLEMQIVKDADKLDRVRIKGAASVDVDRLALDVSRSLVGEAVRLYEDSKVIVV